MALLKAARTFQSRDLASLLSDLNRFARDVHEGFSELVATGVRYIPAAVANWGTPAPKQVSGALDDLAARIHAAEAALGILDTRADTIEANVGILSSYTVAAVPSAAANNGRLIQVTDGNAGAPCLARSNGTDWLVVGCGYADGWPVRTSIPTLTIDLAGAITATWWHMLIETNGGAGADDLNNILGVPTGNVIVLRSADSTRDVTAKDSTGGTGELFLDGDFVLDRAADRLMLMQDASGILVELSRSNNSV